MPPTYLPRRHDLTDGHTHLAGDTGHGPHAGLPTDFSRSPAVAVLLAACGASTRSSTGPKHEIDTGDSLDRPLREPAPARFAFDLTAKEGCVAGKPQASRSRLRRENVAFIPAVRGGRVFPSSRRLFDSWATRRSTPGLNGKRGVLDYEGTKTPFAFQFQRRRPSRLRRSTLGPPQPSPRRRRTATRRVDPICTRAPA